MTATYSPDDNKLRLYASARLDPETYARVRAAGFIYAPKQDLFVAPTWTPQREDLLLDLCGEIDDEDTSLTARAEDRAERFDTYSAKREAEADRAHKAVATLAEGIPFGQPILVGHHSERRARRDAEKIQNGMRRAVRLWETSTYWSQRAEGAIRHAKHKERPDVRARRIKGIEADKRKAEKTTAEAEKLIAAWESDGLTWKQARAIANYDHVHHAFPVAEYPRRPICAECDRPMSPTAETCGAARVQREDGERETVTCAGLPKPASTYEGLMSLWSALAGIITPEEAREIATAAHRRVIAANARWISHYANRLTYERAMLSEAIGVSDVAERFPNIEPGGRVLIGAEWCTVIRVNKSNGKTSTLTTNRRYVRKVGIEEVRDYASPDASEAEAVKRATKLPPLCNYPGAGFERMTKADYERRYHFIRATAPGQSRPSCEPQYAAHRVRCHLKGGGGLDCHDAVGVYLTDERLKFPPIADEQKAAELAAASDAKPPAITPPEPDLPTVEARAARRNAARERRETQPGNPFAAMRDALRSGTAAVPVSAPQLFPTPNDLARRMVAACGTVAGARVLEPSAGTGAIVRAIIDNATGADCVRVVAVEINKTLADRLRQQRDLTVYANARDFDVRHADFLECTPDDLGAFDFVLMNPPFSNGADIAHIEHARRFLKPGGRIVAICANGPRQRAKLFPLVQQHAGEWIDLPAETFRPAGTSVRAAMITFRPS